MRRLLIAALLLCAGLVPAQAQQNTYGYFTTESTGTISQSGVYQQVFAASQRGARGGCLIQNKGVSGNQMLVFFGSTKPANNSGVGYPIGPPSGQSPGGWISCGLIGGGVALDQIWIEGTSGDTFEQASQP